MRKRGRLYFSFIFYFAKYELKKIESSPCSGTIPLFENLPHIPETRLTLKYLSVIFQILE